MDLEFEVSAACGLRRYVGLVERALGLTAGGHCVQLEAPVSVYLPLRDRLARYPDRDVALVWDERRGWAAGVEEHPGADLLVLGYLATDLLPSPTMVARFVGQLYAGDSSGRLEPPQFRDVDDLALRLAAYARPAEISLGPPARAGEFESHR